MRNTHATKKQIIKKLRLLTEDEKLDLWRTAAAFLGGTKFSGPADLFHETVSLLLAGSRRWPTHVGFCCYMRTAMQSVAGASRELHANALAIDAPADEVLDWGFHGGPHGPTPLDELLERERLSIAIKALRGAKAALAGDREAIGVVDGWLRALSESEIRSKRSLSQGAFDAAKKRALRAVHRELADRRD